MSRSSSAIRSVPPMAKRLLLPLLLVVTLGAMPGSLIPQKAEAKDPPPDDGSDDFASGDEHLDPQAPLTDEPSAELVSIDESEDPVGPSAPVVGALSASGIPEVALRAYRAAEATMATDDPGCGLRWSLVAAIGRVESNHGRFGGSQLRADGTTTRPIVGIPLDGRSGVATITDTDGGRFDNDPVYDRAVGPMQFIPSTWRFAGADGNGDGVEDPHNMFDAALAAAGYLCAGDTDLRDPSQRADAVFRYNHSDQYVAVVLALADQYERGVTSLPSVPGASTPPPPLPSPVLPPASVTRPPLGVDPGRTPGTSPTTSTTQPPGSSTSSTTSSSTSSTTSSSVPGSSTSSSSTTSTTQPCPTTTSTVPDPSSTTTTSTTTTTTTTVADPSSTTTTTVPGCATPATAPVSTTTPTTASDMAVLLGALAFAPSYLLYRRRNRHA